MNTSEHDRRQLERTLFEALREAGGVIPHTVEDVKLAEVRLRYSSTELPERLRDPRAVLDQILSKKKAEADAVTPDVPHVFGRLVQMLREQKRLSVEALAEKARVDREELEKIEADANYEAKPRTVRQLADVFRIAPKSLILVANLTRQTDERVTDGAVRFAACSKAQTREQRKAVKQFVRLLNSLD